MTKEKALEDAAAQFSTLAEAVSTLQQLSHEKAADAAGLAARQWGMVSVTDWPSVEAFLSARPTPDEVSPGVHRQLHRKLRQAVKDRAESELFSILLSAVKAMKPLDLYEEAKEMKSLDEVTVTPGVLGGRTEG